MRNFILFPLMAVALLSGCQQNRSTTLSPAVSGQAQLEQLASVAAGARYLKNKCNRSDLPADEAINRAAINVGKKRGWANIDDNLLSQRSAQLYQQLQQDSTPVIQRREGKRFTVEAKYGEILLNLLNNQARQRRVALLPGLSV